MKRRDVQSPRLASQTAVALACALAVATLGGCAHMKKQEHTEEGLAAAQHEAEASAKAQAASGAPTLQGTSSPIPALVPGEGQVQIAAPATPDTAPTGDKFDNDNPGHLLARCRDRAARKEWFDAVGDCRRSYDLNPSSIEPQVELMRLLVTLQAYGDAEDAATKVLAVRPGDPVALYYLAWSYRGREMFPQAIDTLKKAIAAEPKRLEFVQALGMTYCLAGDYGRGIETLEKAQAMAPGDAKTQGALTSARAVLAEKLAPYLKLVQEKPESYDNQAALGFMYQRYGLAQKALSAYDIALAKMPSPLPEQQTEEKQLAAQIYYNRGVVYRDLGKPDLGEPSLWQAMKLDPKLEAVAWYYIGLCRYDEGKIDSSIEALRRSVDLQPNVAENRAALALAFDKAGKTSQAVEQRNAASAIAARDAAAKAEAAAPPLAKTPPAAVAPAPSPDGALPPDAALSPGAAAQPSQP